MIFLCNECSNYGFDEDCKYCGPGTLHVPMDIEYYPEFEYKSKGLVKDIFVKRKEQKQLNEKLEAVLSKYNTYKDPYFVNFMHLVNKDVEPSDNADKEYTDYELFYLVLTRIGFSELQEFPSLIDKLLISTSISFDYSNFTKHIDQHILASFKKTLKSWINQTPLLFRRELPILIYYIYVEDLFKDEVTFNDEFPILDNYDYQQYEEKAESIYLSILVSRYKDKLENFDLSKYLTIYDVDLMSGFDFEDFLGKMFSILGYNVIPTKKTGDQGADLFVQKFDKKIVIQAKNYFGTVGNAAVQQVLAAKNFYDCDEGMVITNSYFTPSAKELAKSTNIKLVDRDQLKLYLEDYNRMIIESSLTESNKL